MRTTTRLRTALAVAFVDARDIAAVAGHALHHDAGRRGCDAGICGVDRWWLRVSGWSRPAVY
jgi:hypothetical protein